jgi:hypothetical protein
MARVLLVGYDPETVDYSNPAYPPGMTAEIISAGIALTLTQMTDRGWESDVCYIRPDKAAGQTVERHLASANYACVVIGAGVRLPPQGLRHSRLLSTRSIGALRVPLLPSIRGPKTAPMLLRDGCRTTRTATNSKTDLANQRGEAGRTIAQVLSAATHSIFEM